MFLLRGTTLPLKQKDYKLYRPSKKNLHFQRLLLRTYINWYENEILGDCNYCFSFLNIGFKYSFNWFIIISHLNRSRKFLRSRTRIIQINTNNSSESLTIHALKVEAIDSLRRTDWRLRVTESTSHGKIVHLINESENIKLNLKQTILLNFQQ